ncbi:MAG: hypothetical protein M1839_008646 [Geoglossum umbratile]|nr:MAG: hypothetical protein M1839_008646 [Geoglossum umbratile]
MSGSSTHGQRIPLSSNTNSLVPSRSPSPQDVADKPAAPLALRRRSSFRRLNPRADSSEDPPSVHSSIFEAPYCSSSEGGDGGEKDDTKASQPRAARDSSCGEESSSRSGETSGAAASSIGPGPRDRLTRLGRTPLETIMEKKSAATIRSPSLARTHSLDGLLPASSQTPSADETPPISRARRKQSFSFDDAAGLDSSKRKSGSTATDEMLPPKKAYRNYAGPNMPTHSRPERIPTPPGMPSWSHFPQPAAPALGPGTPPTARRPRRRDFFFRLPTGTPSSSEQTTSQTPDGIQITTQQHFITVPSGRPRFRPPSSGHRSYGSLDMHPFHRAPLSKPWESNGGRPPYLRPHGTNAMSMQYMRPVQEENTTAATPTAATRPITTCPHTKRSTPDQAPASHHPTDGSTDQRHPAEDPPKKCWKCRLGRWFEQFSTFCCGSIGDYGEGTSYQNFSALPDNPRHLVAVV